MVVRPALGFKVLKVLALLVSLKPKLLLWNSFLFYPEMRPTKSSEGSSGFSFTSIFCSASSATAIPRIRLAHGYNTTGLSVSSSRSRFTGRSGSSEAIGSLF